MEYQGGTLNSSQSVISGLETPGLAAFKPTHSRSGSTGSSLHSRQNSRDWEVMNDIQPLVPVPAPNLDINVPGICEGYMMKKRKYPLKGWHKRYFYLEKGILKYTKTQQEISKGKIHGSLDVSVAVMSINKKSKRIDLDAGHSIYHMKAKSHDIFYIWLTKLSAHRTYRKNEAITVHQGVLRALSSGSSTLPAMGSLAQSDRSMSCMLPPSYQSTTGPSTPEHEQTSPLSSGVKSKVSAWLKQTTEADSCTQELSRCELDLAELGRLIQRLHWLEGGLPITYSDLERRISMQNLTLEKPKKKSGKIWGHSRSHSHSPMYSSSYLGSTAHLGASVQSIPDYVYNQLSTPATTSPEGKKLTQDICVLSTRVHSSLKSIHDVLTVERERVRQAWTGPDLRQSTSDQLATLCSTMSEVDLQTHLTKIHSLSLSSESTEDSFCTVRQNQPARSADRQHMRQLSVAESVTEYFDASEVLICESSSENETDESGVSDITTSNSEPEEGHATATIKYRESVSSAPDVPSSVPKDIRRRTTLPGSSLENGHVGILTILTNNIGKDLSRVSMPVALNEPLNFLQRVSEELEYSELLDIANRTDDLYERMVYVAVFSISGYAWATWRSNYKPFNPVLGETYESVRDDRGFRYSSEQVSHHPPLSACHAESENFNFWQDQRWKYKFWGKSVEIISAGHVNVSLPRYGDQYEWNKVITCIHNVFTTHRHLEHYGDVVIKMKNSDACTCKISFLKARYWSSESSKNEVHGTVLNAAGKVVHRFGGNWHEGISCDTLSSPQFIWKPNTQPEDGVKYFGFSQYARELNELTPELDRVLPPTDSRYRPDQRLLEEGKVSEADKKKDEIENKQRDRRLLMTKNGEEHVPRFFKKELDEAGREVWVTNGTYWKVRENPGFANTDNLDLW
ncbi:oxysterol-binding protein-related protein 7-like isoform X1 [Clupea harengus]|uniref:Oxysterol-binding protein n=1 Tax=Clupea harengus TaxID=7950 RepID=A0A6P8FRK1_CLUHA|nr:oxysterol-binding protein-related protein 7-like isoform X1 [Clupea harengus]XP_031430706.1 oxysterol-binding protein-related protein 7-like isoform X1 [Clupea harengus]